MNRLHWLQVGYNVTLEKLPIARRDTMFGVRGNPQDT